MAISERSQHILDLWVDYNAVTVTQDKAALSKDLKKSLEDLIDAQLHDEQLLATAKRKKFTLAQLKTELLESMEGDLLRLCEELSMQKSARDVVNENLIVAARNLQDNLAYERDADNNRLVELLQAYRLSKQGKRETDELYQVLSGKMLQISEHLARVYNLSSDNAEKAINLVLDKWLGHPDGLLYDWNENSGAAVSSWIYKALNWRMLDLRRKATRYDAHNVDKLEIALDHARPSMDKTQSSLLRIAQLEAKLKGFIDEIVGKSVLFKGKDVLLTEIHAQVLKFLLKNPVITDWQLGEKLVVGEKRGVSKATAGRRKQEVIAYIAAHPSRDELLELLKPCGRG